MLRILVVIGCLAIHSACSQISNAQSGSKSGEPNVVLPRAQSAAIVLLTNACPLTSDTAGQNIAGLGALAIALATTTVSTIAPVLVDASFDGFTAWLERNANDLTASTTARDSQSLYVASAEKARPRSCIIFARGGFGQSANLDDDSASAVTDEELEKIKSRIENIRGPINLTNQLEIYAEFALVQRSYQTFDEKTAIPLQFAVRPVFLSYAQSGAKHNRKDYKQLIFTIEIDRVPVDESDNKTSTIFSQSYDLGRIPFGVRYEPPDLAHLDTNFVPLPRPSKRNIAATDENGNDTTVDVIDPVFVNLRVSLTETEEGGDITRAIAIALKKNKKEFTDPAVEFIVDQLKRALKENRDAGGDN